MAVMDNGHVIRDVAALEAIYGTPMRAAVAKEVNYLHPHYCAFIEQAPFVALATSGQGGLDVTPRGDPAGFVEIADTRTLLLPDRRGNNRIDSLRNLVEDPRIALLFLIPGIGETLRVNGTADISVDPALLERFVMQDKLPRSVLVVHVASVYFQCSKAIMRSELWNPDKRLPRTALPSTGTILADVSREEGFGEAYDRIAPARLQETMY